MKSMLFVLDYRTTTRKGVNERSLKSCWGFGVDRLRPSRATPLFLCQHSSFILLLSTKLSINVIHFNKQDDTKPN